MPFIRKLHLPGDRRRKRSAIRDAIRAHIHAAGMRPGSRMPTTADLAGRFGVSYVTAHSALDDLVREGLLVRQQGRGTFVGRSAARSQKGRTAPLAIVLPPRRSIRDSGSSEVVLSFIQGATDGAAACGADLVSVALRSSELRAVEVPAAAARIQTYGGAIFIGEQFAPLIRRLTAARFPLVMITGRDELAARIDYDQKAGVQLAVAHLVGHGYRRIGFFGQTTGPFSAKFSYFQEALRATGWTWDDAFSQSCLTHHQAAAATEDFLARPRRPDAVFVDNYYKGEILVRTMAYHGLAVPADMAVLAYGTEHAGGIQPPLSYVRVPAEEMGNEAARLLCRTIEVREAARPRRLLPAHLEVRQSCGCREPMRRAASVRPMSAAGILT